MMTHSRVPFSGFFVSLTLAFCVLLSACGDETEMNSAGLTGIGGSGSRFNERLFGGATERDLPSFDRPSISHSQQAPPTSTPQPEATPPVENTPPAPNNPPESAPAPQEPPAAPTPTPPASTPNSAPANSTAFLSRGDTRAMWIWNERPTAKEILENTGAAQDELMTFIAAPHGQAQRAINRLFFEVRGYSNANRFEQVRQADYDPLTEAGGQAKLRAFLKRAHAKGVAVEYLDGQAIWVASDQNAGAPKQICQQVVAFNRASSDPAERFDGIHLDIEPHTVRQGPHAGEWWENRLPGGYNAEWTARWKDILNSCRQTLNAYKAETGHRITLSSDLGTDYAHYNAPILAFLNRADGPLDYLTIMNYFDDRPNVNGDPSYFYGESDEGAVVGGVISNLASWDKLPLLFALETGPESIADDNQSFFQEGHRAMYQTVDTLMGQYATSRNLGAAFHHYSPNSYRDLRP